MSTHKRFGDLLIEKGLLTREQLAEAKESCCLLHSSRAATW
jgi:hypothetical protein